MIGNLPSAQGRVGERCTHGLTLVSALHCLPQATRICGRAQVRLHAARMFEVSSVVFVDTFFQASTFSFVLGVLFDKLPKRRPAPG